ncbi:MAG: RND family transporter, partial [Wujia sp.]
METFFGQVIHHKKRILLGFAVLFVISIICKQFITVNYDMNDYLPEDAASSIALDVMEKEFGAGIPNARVMVRDVSVVEALEYKEKIVQVPGVLEVTWLDDVLDVTSPLEMMDKEVVDTYYKDDAALFLVTIDEPYILSGVADIRQIIGEENAMTGAAVSTAVATNSTVSEIRKIAIFAVGLVLVILVLTTSSWMEPLVVLIGLGVAVVLNAGSNFIFGEISFVTNAAGNILQLAVSLDYSVFLIHRFEECRHEEKVPQNAMKHALTKSLTSILSSGLTTVIGFLALCLMRFGIGPDLGMALAKGIAISLIVVFIFMPGLILMFCPLMDKTKHRPLVPSCRRLGTLVCKITAPLAVVFCVVMIPSYLASTSNSYYYGSSNIFGPGTVMGDDTSKIKETFGENDSYVLMVPKGNTANEYDMLSELKKMEEVSSCIAFVEQAGPQIPYEYLDKETLDKLESENYSRMVLSVCADYEGEETTLLIDKIRAVAQRYYPDAYYLAGEGVSTYDLKCTVTADMIKVNLLAIAAVFFVLLFTMRSVVLPVVLVMTIETAIW